MKQRARLRLAFGLVLLAVLVWLPFEDTRLVWSLILAAAISAIQAAYWHFRTAAKPSSLPVIGMLAGAAVPLIAAFLMLLKSGWHGHSAPDFSWEEHLLVLRSTPAWMVGGLLLGAGIAIQQAASRR